MFLYQKCAYINLKKYCSGLVEGGEELIFKIVCQISNQDVLSK